MSLEEEIEAAALGPAPVRMVDYGRACVSDWVRGMASSVVMTALDGGADPSDDFDDDWQEFCAAPEDMQRMFLLTVAESLRP